MDRCAEKVDFLCIGAQRSGTTWLSRNLRSCPELWLPPAKELHYFTRSKKYDSPSILSGSGLPTKLFGRSAEERSWRNFAIAHSYKWVARARPSEKLACAMWAFHYFIGTPTDEWYISLFKNGVGKVKGELTPAYSLMDSTDVKKVAALLPNLKIILLLRNPIDRVLSQLRMHLDGRVSPILDKSDEIAMFEFATAEAQLARGNYVRTIDIWLSYFPASRIHTAFYEDICEQPNHVLEKVFQFLGVKSVTARTANLATVRTNAAQEYRFSSDFVERVAKVHKPIVEASAARFGGRSSRWCESIRKL